LLDDCDPDDSQIPPSLRYRNIVIRMTHWYHLASSTGNMW
jgi:hypothetical protein